MCLLLEAVRANPLTIESLKWNEKAFALMNVGVPSYTPPSMLCPFVALSPDEPSFSPKQSQGQSSSGSTVTLTPGQQLLAPFSPMLPEDGSKKRRLS